MKVKENLHILDSIVECWVMGHPSGVMGSNLLTGVCQLYQMLLEKTPGINDQSCLMPLMSYEADPGGATPRVQGRQLPPPPTRGLRPTISCQMY